MELKPRVRTRSADWSALLVSADEVIEQSSRMARPVFVRLRNDFCIGANELTGQSTKSLRDSPLRGAGELIKLNPLSTEQGYIGTVIDVD
jgi:hypothetical protein